MNYQHARPRWWLLIAAPAFAMNVGIADEHALVRGALLHDHYLWVDWHDHEAAIPRQLAMGFTHPRHALDNALARIS